MLRSQGILSPPPLVVTGGTPTPTPTPTPTAASLTFGAYGLNTSLATHTTGAANAKGTATSLGTLSQAVDLIRMAFFTANSRPFLIDLRLAGALIATDVPVVFTNTTARMNLPLRVSAGELTFQASYGGTATSIEAIAFAATSTVQETATVCEPIAAVGAGAELTGITGIQPGDIGVSSGWVEIGTSANAVKGVLPFVGRSNVTTGRADERYKLEIGTGATIGVVASIGISSLFRSSAAIIIGDNLQPIMQAFAAGTKFWARLTTLATTASAGTTRTMNVQIHGIR
jgi:hypothetical protein